MNKGVSVLIAAFISVGAASNPIDAMMKDGNALIKSMDDCIILVSRTSKKEFPQCRDTIMSAKANYDASRHAVGAITLKFNEIQDRVHAKHMELFMLIMKN